MFLENIKFKKYSQNIVKTLVTNKINSVSIYCAGFFAQTLVTLLEKENIKIHHIFDYKANTQDLYVHKYKVERPIRLKHLKNGETIVIANNKWLEEVYDSIEYFISKSDISVKVIDLDCNFKSYPAIRNESINAKINPAIKTNSKEYKSIFAKKIWSIYDSPRKLLNPLGYTRKKMSLSDKISIELDEFKILNIQKCDVFYYGGLFTNKKLKLESMSNYDIESEADFPNYMFKKINNTLKQKLIDLFYFFKYFKTRNKIKLYFSCPRSCGNMGHFVMEAYPRLYQSIKYLKEKGIDDFYVICPPKNKNMYKGYMDDILLSLGIDETKRIYPYLGFSDDKKNFFVTPHLMRFKNVLLPTNVLFSKKYSLPAFKYLKKYFYDESFTYKYDKLYLSRKNAKFRKLNNEEKFAKFIEKNYGFKRIFIEDYSFQECVNIMGRATMIIAQEGGVSGNFIFLPKNTKVILLRHFDMQEYFVFHADLVGYDPLFVVGESAKEIEIGHGSVPGFWFLDNLNINLEYFDQKMQEYGIEKTN